VLNKEAAELGASFNVFTSPATGKLVATPPAFISYTPARYLRPFDLPPALPFF
jgi:hypothetical protein